MKISYNFEVFDRMPNKILVIYRQDEFIPFANIHVSNDEELEFWKAKILEWNEESKNLID